MRDYEDHEGSTTLVFTMHEEVGALAKALNIFQVSNHVTSSQPNAQKSF